MAKHADATTVEVELHDLGGVVELTVADDGKGFHPAISSSLLRDGHFGLVGMRERLASAGGVLVVESVPGAGTRADGAGPADRGPGHTRLGPGRGPHGASTLRAGAPTRSRLPCRGSEGPSDLAIRILVVDDDPGLRRELTLLLEDAGYDVVAEASSGCQGVALARLVQPDVVISDLRMPGDIGGLDLAAELQGEIPVIILTAYDDPGLQARIRDAGATFLVKGCRSRTIFAAVEQAVISDAGVPA